MTEVEMKLVHEVEQLILHAEEDTLDYSVLEHARKLIFDITSKCSFKKQCESESIDYKKQFLLGLWQKGLD